MSEPSSSRAGYEPFPAFSTWLEKPISGGALDYASKRLSEARELATPEQLDRALDQARREAAVDTNAIEGIFSTDRGFTRTIATQAAGWELAMDARDPKARGVFEDTLAAYDFLLDAVTQSRPLTEAWIRELHALVVASQDTHPVLTAAGWQNQPLPKGEYKHHPNSPNLPGGGVHHYAPPHEVAPEMSRLVAELRSSAFMDAPEVVQAAYAHYAFVSIHPFADGNGRVARALASVYLYRNPGVPLVVFNDQKNDYFDALELADAGRPESFVRFIEARAIDTANVMALELADVGPSAEESLKTLSGLVGSSSSELVPAGMRLQELALTELQRQLAEFSLPENLQVKVYSRGIIPAQAPAGFENSADLSAVQVWVSSDVPRRTLLGRIPTVAVRSEPDGSADLILFDETGLRVDFAAGEFDPTESESARRKVHIWVQKFWERLFASFAKEVARKSAR